MTRTGEPNFAPGAGPGSLMTRLQSEIRTSGPLPVRTYMQRCISHYYARGSAFGREGDFVTAPEISQIFGELLGLWCVVVWQQLGQPSAFNLVELGPGRGTMMRDGLRAMRAVPACLAAVRVHLVEPSAALRARQAETLAKVSGSLSTPVTWCSGMPDVPVAPTIVLGNEYVDALPVDQVVWSEGSWLTRCVGLDAGALTFTCGARFLDEPANRRWRAHLERLAPGARDGDVVELRAPGRDLASLDRFRETGVAVLLIDYGHVASGVGDTLQAVRRHGYHPPLTMPGEADLTTHVDFAVLRLQLEEAGLCVDPPVTQGAFLASLGIVERASRLARANPLEANGIEMAVGRLMSPTGMGHRFKVLGARSPHLPALPGLPA